MSLSDCINYAVENNPQVQVSKLQLQDAEWRIKENKASGLPQVTGSLAAQRFLILPGLPAEALGFQAPPGTKITFAQRNTFNGTLQASQLIFSGSYLLAIKAAKYYREYVQTQLDATKQTLRNQVMDAYLPALLITENLAIIDKNIANLQKLRSETAAINKAGFAEQLDVDRLDLAISNLQSERGNLARQRELVENALKFTMGMPVSDQVVLGDDLKKLTSEYADADLTTPMNFMNKGDYVTLLKGREMSALNVELFQKPWLPTVAGFVQAQGSFQGSDKKLYWIPQTIAGISVNFTLWDSGTNKARREKAVIGVQTIDAQKRLLENAYTLELENARKTYLNAVERLKNQQKNLDMAQKIYDTTQTKYKAGVGSSFEIVSAERDLFAAQQAVMTANFDLLSAKVAIKKALGTVN